MSMLEKLLLWGVGAVVLAIVGLVFLIKAYKQIKKLK
jgi:hypothetical protein